MARIRSVKPDFWDSPSTAKASLRGRLLYIAMWNWADDWGIGDGNAKRLLSFAFPSDESSEVEPRNFRRLASEVSECFGVVWYEVDGRPYYEIPTWEQHQRTEKKARRTNPPSDQAEHFLYREVSENPPPSVGSSGEGSRKGEGGSRKGEVTTSSDADASDPREADPDHFEEFWQTYPRRDARRKAETAFKAALRRAPADRILAGARRYRDDPNREAAYTAMPVTWLNGDRWDDQPLPARNTDRRPTADDRAREHLALSERLRAQEGDGHLFPQIGAAQ